MNAANQSAIDLKEFADGLVPGGDGLWYSREREGVSYPGEGHALCFELEDESFWFAHRANCICALVRRHPAAGAIFDVGGGNGHVALHLQRAGFSTAVVEPGLVGALNAVRRGIHPVICSSMRGARFREGALPGVGLFDVLEHVENDVEFLKSLHHHIAPGGRLYITVPAYDWLWSHDDVEAGHFRRYTQGTLAKVVTAAGFKPLYSSSVFSILPIPIFLLRALPNRLAKRSFQRDEYIALHKNRLSRVLDFVWSAEVKQIRSGGRIPFGGSCIMAAERI